MEKDLDSHNVSLPVRITYVCGYLKQWGRGFRSVLVVYINLMSLIKPIFVRITALLLIIEL
jgi:hypothetical protein